jgi:hypothetical protein
MPVHRIPLRRQQVILLAIAGLLNGWPAIVALLMPSHLYGT